MVIDRLTWFPPQRTHVAAEFCETPPEAVRCVETSPSRDQPGSEMPRNLSIEEQRLQAESRGELHYPHSAVGQYPGAGRRLSATGRVLLYHADLSEVPEPKTGLWQRCFLVACRPY